MVFKHRQNDSSLWNENTAVELDVRLSGNNRVVLSHDAIKYTSELDFSENINAILYNDKDLPKETIVNIKTSGAEEIVANEFETIRYDYYYFLDSQIPDILRLCRHDKYKGKFVIRVSNVETYNHKLMYIAQPKYIWADRSDYAKLNLDDYDEFINTLTKQNGLHCNSDIIIVSPELYDLKYERMIPMIAKVIKKYGISSVCTKKPEVWEALLAKS